MITNSFLCVFFVFECHSNSHLICFIFTYSASCLIGFVRKQWGESKNCGLDTFKMVFEIKYSSNLCQYLEAFFYLSDVFYHFKWSDNIFGMAYLILCCQC